VTELAQPEMYKIFYPV